MNAARSLVAALVLAGAAPSSFAQDLPCETYKLDNGLTVILHEDHSLPVACINLWYYVGSKDEAPGRSGFAHLFEHLMFMGTKRAPGNAFDVIMETGGGFNNASTSQDRTNYFSFGPSSLLPVLLWLDADRLEDLGREMTQEKLDKQREVVRNERRQTSEMQPYGKAELKITELMYPPGHPYHIETIGTHEDLQSATVRDVKDFFSSYYLPNNASLVVAGDFDPKEIKPLIARLFGTLPRGPEAVHRAAEPARLKEVRRVTYTDQVQFPRLTLVYHSPAKFTPGDADMDLAAAILASGKSSRLYQRLVYEDKLATDVSADQQSQILGSLFRIDITAREGVSTEQIEKATDEVLAKFIREGPTKNELERNQARIEYAMTSRLQSVLAKADRLNEYQFFFGQPNSFKKDLDRYRDATTASVRDWARKALTPDARLVMWVLPETPGAKSPRDEQPGPMASAAFTPPAPDEFTLSNGIPVRFWQRPELPLVAVSMLVDSAASDDAPDKSGQAMLAAEMLDEGAGELGALEFSAALDQLGASIRIGTDQDATTIDLSALKRNFNRSLALYADAILRPRFEDKEWDRVKRLQLESLRQQEDEPAAVAARVGMRAFFGDAHPCGRSPDGTIATVEKLSLADLKACYAERFVPARVKLFIAGDVTRDEAKAALEKAFGGWKNPSGAKPSSRARGKWADAANQALRVVIVDKPKAVQTVIRFFMPAPTCDSPDRVRLELLNTALGGSFTSRLNQNLREKNGYTYGARSRFSLLPRTGYFTAGADVQAEVTGAALKEFFAELNRLRGGDLTSEEAGKTQRTCRSELVQQFQGLGGLLGTAVRLEKNGMAFSSIGQDLSAIDAARLEELNTLARPAIPLDKALLILVGDKATILEQIKGMNLPTPVEWTVRGDPR